MILFLVLSIVHVGIFSWVWYHWNSIPKRQDDSQGEKVKFSILIPVRNEQDNIAALLEKIEEQSYPNDLFEVIVIDDHSEDQTLQIVQEMLSRVGFDLKVISSDVKKPGKKTAITVGVNRAKNPYIITTDGDCLVGRDWLLSYAQAYARTGNVMLTGSVRMRGSGLLSQFQIVEFSSLIGFGAAALNSGNPSMCNGANLSYKREVFLEVGGYEGNDNIPSGDDEFLLQKVFAKYPKQISFVKDIRNIVFTETKGSIGELVNQRIRWSGKWKYHKSWFIKGAAVYVFFDFAVLIISLIMGLTGVLKLENVLAIAGARWLVDFVYLRSVGRFFAIGAMKVLVVSLGLQIIYPVFVSLLGLASIFGGYSWKGRKYS